jgi:hypothetical protein
MSEEITDQVSEEVKQTPEENSPVGLADDGTIKVDLNALNQPQTEEPEVVEQPEAVEQTEEPVQETPVEDSEPVQPSEPVLEEVIEEQVEQATEELTNQVEEAVAEAKETGVELPENIQKVVDFMSETGGTLEDYVRLNTDYSQLNEDQLLREYYQATNPHLDAEDIDFMLEDKFSFEEELDDEREVRRKKVERKQALANAKNHLEGLKSKYYEEVKMGSRLTPDQQKAVEFFNRYNKESEENAKIVERNTNVFKKETDKVFGDSFQGFDYKVGDKTYRFKVKDAGQVRETQGDINNFVKKFLNDKGQISDAKGYHKSLFTAMNADQVAQHFYEQGKADAMKESMARTKNVDMGARGTHENVTTSNGWTIRAVDGGQSSSKLKVKFRK